MSFLVPDAGLLFWMLIAFSVVFFILYKYGFPVITSMIDERKKFIDEARYCRAFVNDKVKFNRWGRIKITAALREKHLPQEHIKEAIDNIDEEIYLQALRETIDIKRRELKGKDDFATQQKIIRHAASRGYEPSLILSTIKYKGDEMDF